VVVVVYFGYYIRYLQQVRGLKVNDYGYTNNNSNLPHRPDLRTTGYIPSERNCGQLGTTESELPARCGDGGPTRQRATPVRAHLVVHRPLRQRLHTGP